VKSDQTKKIKNISTIPLLGGVPFFGGEGVFFLVIMRKKLRNSNKR